MQNRKGTGGLLLAGLAAFAYYKYSKLSSAEKETLVGDLKAKGQKLYDEYVPEKYKSFFSKNTGNTSGSATSGTASANSHFGEGNAYSS
ncbi:hypothetical protein [Segetibacter sp.]|jgi:hypothetical protein|uniref:hypothetical protein n=1 Tax=Segetibacter sp. TaxID=2231182 RepID=UPI002626E58F|nr:hypothetical protein [Segetibacter sp.]MCW3081182.1 hypothetical protein [Segetibacter sp.]